MCSVRIKVIVIFDHMDLRAPYAARAIFHPVYMRSLRQRIFTFLKIKSQEYFDFYHSGHFMNNCAFCDVSL
jgi:hypothetical protein